MRSGEKERLGIIRMITAAIKQREVDERITLDDAQVLSVLEKMIKQRKESLTQFQAGNRPDLVDKETREISLLQGYMPSQLSDAEIDALISDAIAATGAASIKDMGKVMSKAAEVEIFLGIDHPVRFSFDIAGGNGHVEYLLAPRIEAD